MTVPSRANNVDVLSGETLKRSAWLVSSAYAAATLLLLAWGAWSFLFVGRSDLTSFTSDDAPRAQLVAGQLRLMLDCLLCLMVQAIFLLPGLRRRLRPDVVTGMVVVSLFVGGAAIFFGGYFAFIGGIGLEEGDAFPLLWAAAIAVASCAVLLVTAAAAIAVRASLGSTPRWPITVVILIAVLVGTSLTSTLAGSPQIG